MFGEKLRVKSGNGSGFPSRDVGCIIIHSFPVWSSRCCRDHQPRGILNSKFPNFDVFQFAVSTEPVDSGDGTGGGAGGSSEAAVGLGVG